MGVVYKKGLKNGRGSEGGRGSEKGKGACWFVQGSVTVEMAYILPATIMIFLLVLYTVFYYHDKNILYGAAGEVAVAGAQYDREKGREAPDLNGFYRERINRKLILLKLDSVDVSKDRKQIAVSASAGKSWMRVSVMQRAVIPQPEEKIRKKRKLESLTGKQG